MPITYSTDLARQLVHEVWVGNITANDLSEHWTKYLSDPNVMAIRRTLVDLRQANIQFTGAELSELVTRIVLPVLGTRGWITAILVNKPDQYGVSRQYQVFAQTYSLDSIFYDRDEAREWVLQQTHS